MVLSIDNDEVMLNQCPQLSVDILGTSCDQCNAKAWFSNSLCPQKPEGSLGRTALDSHLDSHTAPELCVLSTDDDDVGLHVLGCRVDTLGTNCNVMMMMK